MAESGSPLETARAAAARGAWPEARVLLADLDPKDRPPEDLEVMADAAWWTVHLDEAIGLRQWAYAGYAETGANCQAAWSAIFLCADYFFKGDAAIAMSWLNRAERHLEAEPECAEQGFLAITHADLATEGGDYAAARAFAERALELGRRTGSTDLEVMAMQTLGRALVAEGNVREGFVLLDEAMCAVLAGEVGPVFTGWVFCLVLDACMAIADLKRAGQWAAAAVAWCESHRIATPWHGTCRLHRVEITALHGGWAEAEREAVRATEELLALEPAMAAGAFYAIGELRRRRGDVPGAEAAFRRANELGRDPHPGLALLRLAQGRLEDAAAGLRQALRAAGGPPLGRALVLAAHVEIAVAAGDHEAARAGSAALDTLAAGASPAIEAAAAMARAEVLLAALDYDGAARAGGHAWTLWQELQLPYEAARARFLLGRASRAAGDGERARLELEAAHAAFERLGARLDVARVASLLHPTPVRPAGLTSREIEVLQVTASGKTDREIAAALHLSEHTVGRHLQNIFTKLGVSSRAAATAFAFENGLVAASAPRTAVGS